MVKVADIINECKSILEQGKVKFILGYGNSGNGFRAAPLKMEKPEDTGSLVWDPTCYHNLARFVVDEKIKQRKQKEPDTTAVGVIVKGCDSRAINVLLQEKYINREDVYLIGISCENSGVIDEKKLFSKLQKDGISPFIKKVEFQAGDKFLVTTTEGTETFNANDIMAERCIECKANYPVISDSVFGDDIKRTVENPYSSLEKINSLSVEKKWDFWKEELGKCIRCYGCRSVCPMCFCEECIVDTINFVVTPQTPAEEKSQKIKWAEKSSNVSENFMYHLIRAIHLAGRCIDCNECERVCPVHIPLRHLNKMLEKEAKELFDYEAGFSAEDSSLISSFKLEDPQDFIR